MWDRNRIEKVSSLEHNNYTLDSNFAKNKNKNNNKKDNSKSIELLSYSMGSDLHEDWRKTRLTTDKNGVKHYEPRWKATEDSNFIISYSIRLKEGKTNTEGNIRNTNGEIEVDIANMTFDKLPKDWKAENLAAARVAVNLVFNYVTQEKNISPKTIESFAAKVHDEWLKRNVWAKGGDLDKPYSQLPEVEKSKDRNQIINAINTVKDCKAGRTSMENLVKKYGKYLNEKGLARSQ